MSEDPTEAEYPQTILPMFMESFLSGEQAITSAELLTLPHLFSGIPIIIRFELHCKTAEHGYAIGDIVDYNSSNQHDSNEGLAVIKDATNIKIRFGSAAKALKLLNFTTGSGVAITNANWKLVVIAFR